MSDKPRPTLDTLKKQAKQLVGWHRDGNYSIGGRIRGLARYSDLTDREILALKFPLAKAQEVIAVEQGFETWAALKRALEADPTFDAPAASGPSKLKGAVPILHVTDVTRTAHFFRDKLGFSIDFLHGHPPFYGAVERDKAKIHLRHVHEPVVDPKMRREAGLLAIYIDVENVRGLYEEFLVSGAPMEGKLHKEPWGASTFIIVDPDGNWISFNGPIGT